MRLPEFSVHRPVTVLMIFLAALIIGGVCIWQLPIDLMPEMDIPSISVITFYEGAAPEDVEEKVTDVMERWLSTVPELKHIISKSKEGVSIITLSFEWGTDLDGRANEVRDSVGLAKMFLPDEIDEPRVFKFDISRFPIMVYGVTAKESYMDLEDILDDVLVKPLKRLPGVGSVVANIPIHRQINVDLNREQLAAFKLTPQDIVRAIVAENVDTPAGNIKAGLKDYLIRVPGEYHDITSMRRLVVALHNGSVVRLADVASVDDGVAELQRYIMVNGGPGGVFFVQKQSGANTVKVARLVRERLKELKKQLPPDVQIANIMDSSEDIELMIHDLFRTLLLGGALAMGVVLFFLRRWRATLVIGLTIPFSLILGIIAVYFLGYTINMITLFAMIIAIGMIVDNAIVILENITRHREAGERPNEGAIYGASEVAMAVTASTLTTICIFFPIVFVKGIIKIIFGEFAIIVCVILLGSLFSALTLTPMLSATLMRNERFKGVTLSGFFRWSENVFESISARYDSILVWALSHRKKVVLYAVLIFGFSLLIVPFLGSEFFPEEDRAMLRGTIHLPVGTRIEETARVMREVNLVLEEEIPEEERKDIFTRCGISQEGASGAFGDEGTHIGLFGVKLVPKVERSRHVKEIASSIRKRINDERNLLGFEKFRMETGDPMEAMFMGGELPLTVNIIGDDFEKMEKVAERIKTIVENTPGAVDVSVSRIKGRPELWVNVDRDKAASLGLNLSIVGDTARALFCGRKAGKYRVRGDEYDIFVRIRQEDRSDTRSVHAASVRLPSGELTRIDNIADLDTKYGPVEIDRKDRGRIINVVGNVEHRSLGDVVKDIEAEIGKIDIPRGIQISIAGATEEQRDSFFWMKIALAVGIVLVYMVMASQFESLIDPFVIVFSIPFAFTGAILAILFGGHHISMMVFLGLLMLIGVVVNNAIVMVDYINILRARGFGLAEAVRQACRARLRPVLMTSLTTVCALIPMAFGKGQGSESWNPLGLVVIGGLLVSTLVTLVLVPTMYSIFEARLKNRNNSLRRT